MGRTERGRPLRAVHPANMSNYYDVGTKAWQPDQAEGWVASEVTKKKVDGDNVKLVFALQNGEVSALLYSHRVFH